MIAFFHLVLHWFAAAGPMLAFLAPPPPPGHSPPPGGFKAGNGPQGLSNSPGLSSGVLTAPVQGFAVNEQLLIVIPTGQTGVAQRVPPLRVPPGCQVAIRAHNGTDAGNSHIVRLASQPELLFGVGGIIITPDSDESYPCEHGGQIFFVGTAGDGIVFTIKRASQF